MTATEARAERDRVLSEVEVAHRRVIDAGLEVLQRWADRGQPFSANACREELRAVGVEKSATGALFNAAIKARIIRRVGWETSTDVGTHHKPVARYLGTDHRTPLEVLTVPAHRAPTGRFVPPVEDCGTPPLFEIGGAQ